MAHLALTWRPLPLNGPILAVLEIKSHKHLIRHLWLNLYAKGKNYLNITWSDNHPSLNFTFTK